MIARSLMRPAFVAWLLSAAGSSMASGQAATTSAVDAARELVTAFVAREGLPGFSVAVGVRGELAWAEGFGWADTDREIAVTPGTMFRIGSVSKSLTAAALVRLVERKQLDLDSPVQRYVPTFPEKRWVVTTRQLAGHLAGVRHYRNNEFLLNRPFASVSEGLTIFADDSLMFQPGARYSYSSYGWNLISAVMEGASGQEFLAFMRETVFAPLGMDRTAPDRADSIIPARATPYSRRPGRPDAPLFAGPTVDNSYKWAGGGFLSTPTDLVAFGMAHLAPGFHREDTLDLLFTSQRTTAGEEIGYGIGWRVGTDDAGRRIVWHGGGSVGGTTRLLVYPEEGVVVAIVTNLGGVGYGELARRIAALFLPGADGS